MKRICLVRDEREFWYDIATFLAGVNADLIVLEGQPGSQEIRDKRPDLIICGAEVQASMMSRLRRLPIIVVTEEAPPGGFAGAVSSERNLCTVHWPVPRRQFLDCTSRMLSVPPRNAFKTLIRIYADESDMGTIGQSLDFSTGGISFQTESRLSEGQKCQLSFYVPDASKRLRLHVRVVRCRRDDSEGVNVYGATFVGLRAEEQRLMTAFVRGE